MRSIADAFEESSMLMAHEFSFRGDPERLNEYLWFPRWETLRASRATLDPTRTRLLIHALRTCTHIANNTPTVRDLFYARARERYETFDY